MQHLGVEFDGGGLHADFFVAKLGERPGAQAELQRLALGRGGRIHQKQPGHHALDVFMHQHIGRVQQHRALDPFAAQMQVAHRPFFRKVHFGQLDFSRHLFNHSSLLHGGEFGQRALGVAPNGRLEFF